MLMRRQRGTIVRPSGRRKTWSIKYRDQFNKQHWEGGFCIRSEAQAKLNEVLPQVDSGAYVPKVAVTFGVFAEKWIASRLRVRGSTASGYQSIVKRQLTPRLGKLRVGALQLEHIQRLVIEMVEAKSSTKTIHNTVTLLRTMLAGERGSALRLGYIGHDPTMGLEVPELIKPQIVPPTKEQAWALIGAAREIGGTGYPAAFLGAHTGVRRNELLALRFDDIDWFAKELCVRRAISKAKGTDGAHKWQWVLFEPKSKKSRRRIGLTESTLTLLSSLKRMGDPEGFILPGPDGSWIDPDFFDAEIWKPVSDHAKIPCRFHDLRHFFASQLIAQGETAAYVRDQLGHSSIQVTFDTYGHLFPAAVQEATARLEKAMSEAKPKAKKTAAEPIGSNWVAHPEVKQ